MSKTLSNILTVFKVAKIIAKVVYILCIVGSIGCFVAVCTLPVIKTAIPAEWLSEKEIELAVAYPACFIGLFTCVGEGTIAFLAERCFGKILNAGTPFTQDIAKDSFRFGLSSIIISVAVSILSGITLGILIAVFPDAKNFDSNSSLSISTGLFFMFLSLFFKYGAELKEPAAAESTAGETEQNNNASDAE